MNIPELAKLHLRDYDAHRPGSLFEQPSFALTIAEAYALQFEVARLREARGETIIGYKVGCVSRTVQAQLGISQPVFGHIFETELHKSGATLDPTHDEGLALEGEFAVRGVTMFPVIELHNYVVRRPPLTAEELIANNALHAGVVMPFDAQTQATVQHEPIAVVLNNQIVGTANAGDPLASIAKLRHHLYDFGRDLLPDHIVLTGSPLPLYRVKNGDSFEVRSGHLGSAKLTVLS